MLRIYPSTPDIDYAANEVYLDYLSEAEAIGLMTRDEAYELLLDYGLWDEQKEEEYNTVLPRHVEKWRKYIYLERNQPHKVDLNRELLYLALDELQNLAYARNTYEYYTCHGVAMFAKWQYIIENCTYYEDGRKYDWQYSSITDAFSYYQNNLLSDKVIRRLARCDEWLNIWSAGKKNCFGKASVYLSDEQLRIINWSSFYENIHKSPECPESEVIEDEDMLDGWIIVQQEKRKEAEKEKKKKNLNDKDEYFLPAANAEDAKKVNEMNTDRAKAIKDARIKAIKKKQKLSEKDLPDVKQRLGILKNRIELANRGKRR